MHATYGAEFARLFDRKPGRVWLDPVVAGQDCTARHLELLHAIRAALHRLRALHIRMERRRGGTTPGVQSLLRSVLSMCGFLEVLELEKLSVAEHDPTLLGSLFSYDSLRDVRLHEVELTGPALGALADGLKSAPNLQTVYLARCVSSGEDAVHLVSALKGATKLQTLAITSAYHDRMFYSSGKPLVVGDAVHELRAAIADIPSLTSLALAGSKFTHSCEALLSDVAKLPHLRALCLDFCDFRCSRGADVVAALHHAAQLQQLEMYDVKMDGSGGAALCAGLERWPGLQTLTVTKLGCLAGFEADFGRGLRHVPKLRVLKASRLKQRAESVLCMAEALAGMGDLEELELEMLHCGFDAVMAVVRAGCGKPRLRSLKMKCANVDEHQPYMSTAQAVECVRFVQQTPSLTHVA